MKRSYQKITALLLTAGLLASCAGQTDTPSISNSPTVNSPSASSVPSQAAVNRVVTLTPLTSDIVYQLDRTKLVGVSGSKLTSQDARFKELPGVTGDRTPPNLEQILALKPDFVIGASGFHDAALKKLEELGIATLATDIDGLSALVDLTQTLAQATQSDPAQLLARYQSWIAQSPTQDLSTLVLVSQQPILSPNKDSWAGDLLGKFTHQNVAAELQGQGPMQGYVTLSPEKVLEADPEVIIVIDQDGGTLEKLKSLPFWRDLQAVQAERVYVMDYYGFVNPGNLDKIEAAVTQLKQVLSVQSPANQRAVKEQSTSNQQETEHKTKL